jgi:hypothetical protein
MFDYQKYRLINKTQISVVFKRLKGKFWLVAISRNGENLTSFQNKNRRKP